MIVYNTISHYNINKFILFNDSIQSSIIISTNVCYSMIVYDTIYYCNINKFVLFRDSI